MRKHFTMYEEAVSHCNCSILNFLLYEENLIFFFISAYLASYSLLSLLSMVEMSNLPFFLSSSSSYCIL
jgi:hypothetical protein